MELAVHYNIEAKQITCEVEASKGIDNVLSRVSRKKKWFVRRAEALELAGRFQKPEWLT